MRDKLLRALGPTGRIPLPFGEHKMQGVILILESININLA